MGDRHVTLDGRMRRRKETETGRGVVKNSKNVGIQFRKDNAKWKKDDGR